MQLGSIKGFQTLNPNPPLHFTDGCSEAQRVSDSRQGRVRGSPLSASGVPGA